MNNVFFSSVAYSPSNGFDIGSDLKHRLNVCSTHTDASFGNRMLEQGPENSSDATSTRQLSRTQPQRRRRGTYRTDRFAVFLTQDDLLRNQVFRHSDASAARISLFPLGKKAQRPRRTDTRHSTSPASTRHDGGTLLTCKPGHGTDPDACPEQGTVAKVQTHEGDVTTRHTRT